MAIFNPNEYYQILTKAIRVDTIIPFNCYLLLEKNNHIICIVKSGDNFAKEKINKLFSYEYSQLYIRFEDKEKYFQYLDVFFQSEEGRELLQKAKENQENIVGIPDIEEYSLTSLNEIQQEQLKQNQNKTDSLKKIINLIHYNADQIEEQNIIKENLNEEEKQIIKGITENIKDEITKINNYPENAKDLIIIKSTTKQLQEKSEEIKKISHNKDDKTKNLLENIYEKIKQDLEDISNTKLKDSQNKKTFYLKIKNLNKKKEKLNSLITSNSNKLIESSLDTMIDSIENMLGVSIYLSTSQDFTTSNSYNNNNNNNNNVDNTLIKSPSEIENQNNQDNQDNKKNNTQISSDNQYIQQLTKSFSEEKKELLNIISSQQNTILEIKKQTNKQSSNIEKIKQNWQELQNIKFNQENELFSKKVHAISKYLMSTEYDNQKTISLIKKETQNINSNFFDKKNIENNISQDLLFNKKQNNENKSNENTNIYQSGQEIQEEDDEIEDSNIQKKIPQLQAEIKILKSQLKNARKIMHSSSNQVMTLEKILEEGDHYIDKLESESEEQKKEIRKLLDKTENLENQKNRFESTLDDSNKKLFENKMFLNRKEEIINEFKHRETSLLSELNLLKSKLKTTENLPQEKWPENVIFSLKNKETEIEELRKKIEKYHHENIEIKKTNRKMESSVSSIENVKKDLSQKIERLKNEISNLRKSQQGLNIKNKVLSVNLNEARKSVSKLTNENELIRSDRVKFIHKTNIALAELKNIMTKHNRLNQLVETQDKKNEQLSNKIDNLKNKEFEQNKKFVEIQKKLLLTEKENDKLKQKIQQLEFSFSQEKLDKLNDETQKINQQLNQQKQEQKKLEKELIIAQNENQELNQQIKKLNLIIQKSQINQKAS